MRANLIIATSNSMIESLANRNVVLNWNKLPTHTCFTGYCSSSKRVMNLVGGYESSEDENDGHTQDQKVSTVVPRAPASPPRQDDLRAPEISSTTSSNIGDGAKPIKRRKAKSSGKPSKSSKKKKVKKIVNALVLSPEIQAALARGDRLGDSDSDDASDKKPPKIMRPPGSNPNDLLSLLPQPSTAANADAILLKAQRRRHEASQAGAAKPASEREKVKEAEGGNHAQVSASSLPPSHPSADGGVGKRDGNESDSNGSDGEDLLENMRAKSGSADGGKVRVTPLFTLPSRSKPPLPAALSTTLLNSGDLSRGSDDTEACGGCNEPTGVGSGGMVTEESSAAQAGSWGVMDQGQSIGAQYQNGVGPHASQGLAPTPNAGGGGYHQAAGGYEAMYQQEQHAYYSGMNQATAVGMTMAASEPEADQGTAGGKASKRKGRDMERALARGDLGALGKETPVMDLHQGDNEYNPLRSKPPTAAMKPEPKHIEASVYDPRSGTTKKTLEPTSLQKRKHQINQLAAQAASMERDLMERSGASRITKAQTRSKYGW